MDIARQTGIVHHTAHPHLASDGAVFNLATVPKIDGPHYCVVNFPRVDPGKILKFKYALVSDYTHLNKALLYADFKLAMVLLFFFLKQCKSK